MSSAVRIQHDGPPVTYDITEDQIGQIRDKYAGLTIDAGGYEAVKAAVQHCTRTRSGIETRRKDLKKEALEYGRRVDTVAKRLVSLVRDIETPLVAEREKVDGPKREAKRVAEARKKAEEEARLTEAKAKIDAEQAALRAGREKLEAERTTLRAEQERASRMEFERQAKIKTEAEAKAQAERDRVATEEARVAEAERVAAIQARMDALRPDALKIQEWATRIKGVADDAPAPDTKEAFESVDRAARSLRVTAKLLKEKFGND